MIAKLIVDGKEFPIEIQDPELQKLLVPQKKTGYKRVESGEEFWCGFMSIWKLIVGTIEPAFVFVLPFVWFEETPCAGVEACHKRFERHVLVYLLARFGIISLLCASILVSRIGIESLR